MDAIILFPWVVDMDPPIIPRLRHRGDGQLCGVWRSWHHSQVYPYASIPATKPVLREDERDVAMKEKKRHALLLPDTLTSSPQLILLPESQPTWLQPQAPCI